MASVKKLQIMIEEDLDAALGQMARDEGTSKAALIRMFVRDRLGPTEPLPPIDEDPLFSLVGLADVEPASVDDVVYPL